MERNCLVKVNTNVNATVLICICFVGVCLLGMFAEEAISAPPEPIKIGVIHDISGPAAVYGANAMKGHDLARDKINKKGGILGRPIKYYVRDHKAKSDVASRSAEELILREKVDFLAGTTVSSCGLAISEMAKKHKILFVDGACKTTKMTAWAEGGHRYTTSISSDSDYEGGALAYHEKDTPNEKYWVIGWDYEYAHSVMDVTKATMKKYKPDCKIIGETWTKMGETDFTPYITRILASKPDAMFGILLGSSWTAFAKQAAPYDFFKKIHVVQSAEIGDEAIARPTGRDFPDGVMCNAFDVSYFPDTPEHNEWVRGYLETTGESFLPGFAIQGYLVSMALFQAIEAAGTTETEKVIDVMHRMEIKSPVGAFKYYKDRNRFDRGAVWGTTKFDPSAGFVKLINPMYLSAAKVWD